MATKQGRTSASPANCTSESHEVQTTCTSQHSELELTAQQEVNIYRPGTFKGDLCHSEPSFCNAQWARLYCEGETDSAI